MRTLRKHHNINKEYLIREYIDKGRSAFSIANEMGVRAKLIIQRLHRFGIACRTIQESNSSEKVIEVRKKTCLKKYGCDNVSKHADVIKRIKDNTNYKKLGELVSKSLRRKTKEEWIESARKRSITFLQRYGVSNISQLPDTKRKMRLSAIQRVRNCLIDGGQIYPSYNPDACRLIEEYGKKHGYNFQHAKNGGEYFISHLGYWVDGYDKYKNVVLEVDEPHHFNDDGTLLLKDIKRQKEIEDYLKCKFIRIKYDYGRSK